MLQHLRVIATLVCLLWAHTSFAEVDKSADKLWPLMERSDAGVQRQAELKPIGLTGGTNAIADFSYVGDIALRLVFQGSSGLTNATFADLQALRYSDALATKVAMDNLMRLCPPKIDRFDGNLWSVSAPYRCPSVSYLLLDALWVAADRKNANGIVAALPTKDGPIWFVPADDASAVERLATLVKNEQAGALARPLSSLLYLHKAGAWQTFNGAGRSP